MAALPRRAGWPKTLMRAGGRAHEAEHGAHQRGLAGAVGAEHANEFAVLDRQADVGENRLAADRKRYTVEGDGTHAGGPANAFSVASISSSIHST